MSAASSQICVNMDDSSCNRCFRKLVLLGIVSSLVIIHAIGYSAEVFLPVQKFFGTKLVQANNQDKSLVVPTNSSAERPRTETPAADVIREITRIAKSSEEEFGASEYEQDLVQCKTPVFTDNASLAAYLTNRTALPPCSPSVFRKVFEEKKHFYSDGVWFAADESNPTGSVFYPKDCYFDETAIRGQALPSCLRQKGISKIFLHGDSNGYFYFESLLAFFANRSRKCELDREEKGMNPNDMDEYFQVPGKPNIQKAKGCSHCFSKTFKCYGLSNPDANSTDNDEEDIIVLEYIGMLRILDNRIKFKNKRQDRAKMNVTTFLDYLFRDYFPYRGVPDLWIMSPPFHHESWEVSFDQHMQHMMEFVTFLDEYLPPNTRLLQLTDSRECAILQPRWVFEQFRTVSNDSKNEVLHVMNQILFDALEQKLLSEDSNVLGFMDVGVLSCPFTCRWHFDGAHMLQQWYDIQVKFIFEHLCSEKG